MSNPTVAAGKVLTFTAPLGGVVSGEALYVGVLLVIPLESADAGNAFAGACTDVWRVPKLDAEAWSEGDPIYFDPDNTPPVFTTQQGSLALVGIAIENIDASPATATGLVRLDGAVRP